MALSALASLEAQAVGGCTSIAATTAGYIGPYSSDCNVIDTDTIISNVGPGLLISNNIAMGSLANRGSISSFNSAGIYLSLSSLSGGITNSGLINGDE